MDTTSLSAAILSATTLVAVLALRRLSNPVRIVFDLLFFLAITLYLIKIGVSPLLDAPAVTLAGNALSLRIVAGAWWLLGARVLVAVLWVTLHRNSQSRAARLSSDVTGALIYIGAIMVIVKAVFALPLTGVLATSGLFAIVLGLALQNTLGDVFAGIAVGVESPFKVGDRIALADKLEGQVVRVNWRSVWIQTDDDDVAIIPNSLVAKNQIINRSYPSQRRSVSVDLSCPRAALPKRVIDTVFAATWLCPTILRSPTPSVALTRLGRKTYQYSIRFSVDGTRGLASTKGMLLRQCHRQLYYAGLLLSRPAGTTDGGIARPSQPLPAWQLLRDLVLFECLEDKSLDHLVEELASTDLESGEVLFAEHSADATLYIVASGVTQLVRSFGSESAQTIGAIGAGDYIGEIGLLTGSPHAATAVCVTPSRVYKLSRSAIEPLLAANANLASAFDKSVRRDLDILHREAAVHVTDGPGNSDSLLSRIREYFHLSVP